MDAPVPQPAGSTVVPQDLRTWTHVVYALHAFSLLTGIVGAATVVGASPDAYSSGSCLQYWPCAGYTVPPSRGCSEGTSPPFFARSIT
jgi:hypothetical protein